MIQVGLGIARLTWTKAMIWNFSCQWRTLTRTWASFEASLRADVQFFLSSFWDSESTPSGWWIINANKNKHWKIGRGFQLSWNLIPINFDGQSIHRYISCLIVTPVACIPFHPTFDRTSQAVSNDTVCLFWSIASLAGYISILDSEEPYSICCRLLFLSYYLSSINGCLPCL